MISLLILICPLLAKADWFSICPSYQSEAEINKQYYHPDGREFWLTVSKNKIQQCETLKLPVSAEELVWLETISPQLAKRLGIRISLQGRFDLTTPSMSEILPEFEIPSANLDEAIPIYINLLSMFALRSFGVENRVTIEHVNNSLNIHCREGTKPSGVLLYVKNKKIPGFENIRIELQYKSDNEFSWGISGKRRFDQGDPIILSKISAQRNLQKKNVQLPIANLDKSGELYWSFICPEKATLIQLHSLSLLPGKSNERASERGMWFWNVEDWLKRPQKVLQRAKKYHSNKLFISVLLDEINQQVIHAKQLAEFIQMAKRQNISVWVVEGDPHAILPLEQKRFVKRAEIIQAFNETIAPPQQLAGVQYDIEPYLVSGYNLGTEQWLKAYVSTISMLHSQLNLPIEIVIPFWWQFQQMENKFLLDHLKPYIHSVNVMNYRSDPAMLHVFAQPILSWAIKNQTAVNIALELGPIPDETHRRYQKNSIGELWLVRIKQSDVLLLLNHSRENSQGQVYKFQFERDVSGDLVSFKRNQEYFEQLLPVMEKQWQQWSSFQGISIHGLDNLN